MKQFTYFPILRWKRGEQIATRKLVLADREPMLPIAKVQTLEAGGEQPKLRTQIEQAAARTVPIGIDLCDALKPTVPLSVLARLTASFQANGLQAWPVVHAADALLDLPGLAQFKGQPALILRVDPHHALLATTTSLVATVRKACSRALTKLYVVLDLNAIGEIDLGALVGLLEPFAHDLLLTNEVTQVAAVGGSFPYTLGGFKIGVGNRLQRKELAIWKLLRKKPGCQAVAFGDYCVTNPKPLEDIDPRAMNPSAAIRYTLQDAWWLLRASGVRTKGKGGMGQYNDLCRLLIASTNYSGPTFSFGDQQYEVHAQTRASSGNLTTWRRDATNHHLVYTVRQLLAGHV